MTLTAEAPTETTPPPATPAPSSARRALPVWLRTPPRRPVTRKAPPTPRQLRWWAGVVWFLVSALLLGFVAHVTLIGSLQHVRAQHLLYQELRTNLALAVAPLGQLDFNGDLVAHGTPIALISIKSIGVDEVVVEGTNPTDLMSGPGHRRDSVYPGQEGTSIIMGRQATYGGPFSGIAGLKAGDEITITTGQGVATYEVFGVRQEGDLLPLPLKDGEGRLELITADGVPLAPSGAIHIDAELTSEVQTTPSPSFTLAVLDHSELAMASDGGGWFEALFWLQWLIAAAIALRWVRRRWGMWQTWVIALPVLLWLGAATAGATMTFLPNLL